MTRLVSDQFYSHQRYGFRKKISQRCRRSDSTGWRKIRKFDCAGRLTNCHDIVTMNGTVEELRCTLDPDSRPGMPGSNRKVKGTIHWVSAKHAVPAEIRLYDRLFSVPDPDNEEDRMTCRDFLNPLSVRIASGFVERSAAFVVQETQLQFERLGFFVADRRDHAAGKPVFNRTVTLRDTWAGKAGS